MVAISSRFASHDVVQGSHVAARAIVMQRKTQRPVQFEIAEQTRDALAAWIATDHLKPEQFLFPSRVTESPHLSTRQYSRIVGSWVRSIGLDPAAYRTHSLRQSNAARLRCAVEFATGDSTPFHASTACLPTTATCIHNRSASRPHPSGG